MRNGMMTPLLLVAALPGRVAMESGYYRLRPTERENTAPGDPGMLVRVKSEEVGLATVLPSTDSLRKRFGLTPRQAQVTALLARRRSNEEIAEALVISPHTARRHTESVFLKLGVSSRLDVRSAVADAFLEAAGASPL